jgi:hypothetical protein
MELQLDLLAQLATSDGKPSGNAGLIAVRLGDPDVVLV